MIGSVANAAVLGRHGEGAMQLRDAPAERMDAGQIRRVALGSVAQRLGRQQIGLFEERLQIVEGLFPAVALILDIGRKHGKRGRRAGRIDVHDRAEQLRRVGVTADLGQMTTDLELRMDPRPAGGGRA